MNGDVVSALNGFACKGFRRQRVLRREIVVKAVETDVKGAPDNSQNVGRVVHLLVSLGLILAVDKVLKRGFAAAMIKFPSALFGMFCIYSVLLILDTVRPAAAKSLVDFFEPATTFIQRWLPLFYVPSLVVLPLAVKGIPPSSGAKIGAILGAYLTKSSSNPGAGDILMGFLGSVIISFAFSMFRQRKLVKRHAAEIFSAVVASTVFSLYSTAAVGRLIGLEPTLTVAMLLMDWEQQHFQQKNQNPFLSVPSPMHSQVLYVIIPFAEPTAVLQTIVEACNSLGSIVNPPDKERRLLTYSQVGKALNSAATLDETLHLSVLFGFSVPKLVLQVLTAETILKVSKPPVTELAILKEIAFTVYNKARRIPRWTPVYDTLQPATPSLRARSGTVHMGTPVPGLWKDCVRPRTTGGTQSLSRDNALEAGCLQTSAWDNSWQTRHGESTTDTSGSGESLSQDDVHYLFEPLFILAEPGSLDQGVSLPVTGTATPDSLRTVSDDTSGSAQPSTSSVPTDTGSSLAAESSESDCLGAGNQKAANLHCCYGWTEDWQWLVCVWTDARGELLDVHIFPFGGISGRQDTKGLQSLFIQVLQQGCQILSVASDVGGARPRSIVVARIGSFYELECQGSEKVDDHGESYHIMEVGSFKRGGNIKDDILGRCGVPLTGKQERSDAKRSGHGNVKRSNGGGLGLKMDLSHACPHPNLNSSWTDAVLQSLARDRLRLNFIQSKMDKYNKKAYNKQGVNLPVQSGNQIGYDDYFVTAGFGTPTKDFILTIDTGSDVTWMQCQPCASTEPCYTQQNPIFDPKQSSSYKPLDCQSPKCSSCSESNTCSYDISYGDGSTSSGDVGQDTLKLGSDTFEDFAFGCGHDNQGLFNGTAGIIGLGRTSISLVSQTTSKYGGQFSYCLPDFGSLNPGSLSMGDGSIPSSAVFTPLLADSLFDSLYSVGLNAISVGDKPVSVPSSGSVGRKLLEDKQVETIIDSGTVISRLDQPLYDAFKDAFTQMTPQLPRADPFEIFDTCFHLTGQSQVTVPTVTFHFKGGADVDVDAVGTLLPFDNDGSYVCLAFAPTSSGGLNIIGNVQQQRLRVAYDTLRKRIGFAPESCST